MTRTCASCGQAQQRRLFSATQWKKKDKAKCKGCVQPPGQRPRGQGPTPRARANYCTGTTMEIGARPTTLKMYHGTSWERAKQIKEAGFVPSPDGLMGPGVYVAREDKATRFAQNTQWHGGSTGALITLLISFKRAKFVSDDDKTWQDEGYDACRTTKTSSSPNMEWCVASSDQVTIISIAKIDCDSGQEYHEEVIEVPNNDSSEQMAANALLDPADQTRLTLGQIEACYGTCVLFFKSFGLNWANPEHCNEALSISIGVREQAVLTARVATPSRSSVSSHCSC